jgi:hypothetical protein
VFAGQGWIREREREALQKGFSPPTTINTIEPPEPLLQIVDICEVE